MNNPIFPSLNDPYLIPIQHIDAGAEGEVWLVFDLLLHERFAAKIAHNPYDRNRFGKSMVRQHRCRGPGIVGVRWLNLLAPKPFALLDWMPNGSLKHHLDRGRERGLLHTPATVALDEVLELAQHLGHLHNAGVVHRDVKPGNILIDHDYSFKLSDLGHSATLGLHTHLNAMWSYGTPIYAAPEMSAPLHRAGYESDIYSLGVILYELLMGVPLKANWNEVAWPSEVHVDVPKEVDDLIRRLAHPDPERRPRNGKHAASEILHVWARTWWKNN